MRIRISPAFVLVVLALVLASGGVGYAAGKITSADIKDRTITGRDIKKGSIPRSKLDHGCQAAEEAAFGGCVRRAATGPSSYQAAIDDCNGRNGRLPTIGELKWIAAHDEYEWANGAANQYEFTGDHTTSGAYTPIAFDRGGNPFTDASANSFWHHCITY